MKAISISCWLLVLLLANVAPQSILAAESGSGQPQLNVIFFTPADVEPPPGVVRRLTQVADYTEKFLVDEMTRNGYPPQNTSPFVRDEQGNLQVLFVKGDQPLNSKRYHDPSFRMEAINKAVSQYRLPKNRSVWWVWVYLGDPPVRYSDYRGSGESRNGGWALNNYSSLAGEIDPKLPMASGFHEEFSLKACVHELGHALGLPHLGPKSRDRQGIPLMGPRVDVYHKKVDPREKRIYLSNAEAAMLWKHPIFTGTVEKRFQMPNVELKECSGTFNRPRRYFELNGQVQADIPAHSVIVVEQSPEGKEGESYWRKSFAGRVDEQGKFSVRITELDRTEGNLQILFCFENGIVTGDGKADGLKGSLLRPYRANRNGMELVDGR